MVERAGRRWTGGWGSGEGVEAAEVELDAKSWNANGKSSRWRMIAEGVAVGVGGGRFLGGGRGCTETLSGFLTLK